MGEGLYTTDKNGLLITMNPAAEKILGWTAEELRGEEMHAVIHHSLRDGSPHDMPNCPIQRVLTTGAAVLDVDDLFITRDGSFLE